MTDQKKYGIMNIQIRIHTCENPEQLRNCI